VEPSAHATLPFFIQQRNAANISIKINTTKEYVTDLTHAQEQDRMGDKVEVRFPQLGFTNIGLIPWSSIWTCRVRIRLPDLKKKATKYNTTREFLVSMDIG